MKRGKRSPEVPFVGELRNLETEFSLSQLL